MMRGMMRGGPPMRGMMRGGPGGPMGRGMMRGGPPGGPMRGGMPGPMRGGMPFGGPMGPMMGGPMMGGGKEGHELLLGWAFREWPLYRLGVSHFLLICVTASTVQGDHSKRQKPHVDLYLDVLCRPTRAVGSYSSCPSAARVVGIKSTGGFYHCEWSSCKIC